MIYICKRSFDLEIILEILQVLVLWSNVSDHVYILSKCKKNFFPPVLFFIKDHIPISVNITCEYSAAIQPILSTLRYSYNPLHIQFFFVVQFRDFILSHVRMIIDGMWVGNWIYFTLIQLVAAIHKSLLHTD